jgi:Tfp pilus assembly protein PilO
MNKSLIIPILLFIAFLSFVYLIMPEYDALDKAKQNRKERELELRSVENYYEKIQGHVDQLEEHKENLSKIDSALPNSASFSAVANFLQTASSESGVFLETISVKSSEVQSTPKKGEDVGDKKELPSDVSRSLAEIQVYGHYDNFKNFIELIERSARFFEIRNINLSTAGIEEVPILDLSLNFYSY